MVCRNDDARHLISVARPTCGEAVYADQGYYSITGEHWACSAGAAKSLIKEPAQRLGARKRRREGEGKLALRIRKLAIAAIEQATGGAVHEVTMWNQQGAYRGQRWDLDAWGIHFRILLDGRSCAGSASSMATMTACLRDLAEGGKMVAENTGEMHMDFNLSVQKMK